MGHADANYRSVTKIAFVLLAMSCIAACASPKFKGYEVTKRDGWIFYEFEESLLPPLSPDYVDPEPQNIGDKVQREFIRRAKDLAAAKLTDRSIN
jgi:hypothetical protein